MRSDMDRVLVERPRHRGRKERREPRWKGRDTEPEEMPRFVSTSRGRYGSKHLSDLLGPLRRFLRRRVGRPWDEVYSEIRQNLAPRRHLDLHILEHLRAEVTLHPHIREDGVVCTSLGWTAFELPGGSLYVCPGTGVLRALPFKRRRRHQRPT